MNKIVLFSTALIGLFTLANLALAQVEIPNPLSSKNFGDLLLKIAGAVGALIASLGTIMIIVAGILFLTSAGSVERMTTARKALFYAIIGIVIGIAAKAIVEIIKDVIGA